MAMSSRAGWAASSMDNTDDRLAILQVATTDIGGGAESVAWNLFRSYRSDGHRSWLVVGRKWSGDPDVLPISGDGGDSRRTRAWRSSSRRLLPLLRKVRGAGRVERLARGAVDSLSSWERLLGHEDFGYPATFGLLGLPAERPTIVHCHNLHGRYFDLRALPWLSSQVPTIVTLHDAWLLSGHCAHSFGCERWETGCGECPNLSVYPAIRRDATAFNWQRKREIYAKSRIYVSTPCEWLMEKVQRSMLAPAIVEARVIHNGLDLSVFQPADRQSARATLGIPQDSRVLLFTAYSIRRNPWKDYGTLRSAVAQVAERMDGQHVLCVALGEDAPAERVGAAELRFVPHQKDPAVVACHYQSADVYVHPARAETMSLAITEALACGTPVVATAVGGIPEQVAEGRNGFLVPPGEARAMADAVVRLLGDETLRRSLSRNAAEDARRRFDLKRQVDAYVSWYREISARS
jgi:glycosyltransferase involved in cell wall biosynthesis